MKQHTTQDQTAKLIELGLADSIREERYKRGALPKNFSIGELLSLLPKEIDNDTLPGLLGIYIDHNKMWTINYSYVLGELYSTYRTELTDALYDMIVKLKEEGVI